MIEKEIDFPVGSFNVKGNYSLDIGDDNYIEKEFNLVIKILESDYDYDTVFPEEQESLIIQEKISRLLPKNHFDINLDEWEQL